MAVKCIVLNDIHGLPSDEACFLGDAGLPVTVHRANLADLLGIEVQGDALHRQLVENGGFDAAAARVREVFGSADIGLGYSAGGTVLWRSVLLGFGLKRLICISSTRLRDQTPEAMRVPALAIFGDQDAHRPPATWGAGSGIQVVRVEQADHAFYRSRDGKWMEGRRKVLAFIRSLEIPT